MLLKKICMGILISFLLMAALVIQAGIAVVDIKTPDTRLWIPVPLLIGHVIGAFIELPISKEKDFKEFLEYRPVIIQLLKQFKDLPDAELVTVESKKENVRIFKQADALWVKVDDGREKVQIRIPVKMFEKMIAVLESPNPNVGDLVSCLEWQPGGDLVRIENETEKIRISIL